MCAVEIMGVVVRIVGSWVITLLLWYLPQRKVDVVPSLSCHADDSLLIHHHYRDAVVRLVLSRKVC